MVWHADLDHAPMQRTQLDEQLCRQEGATRREPDVLEGLPAEELAGAVDVAHLEAEEEPQAGAIDPRICEADGRVGALDAVTDDDIRECRGGRIDGLPHPVEQGGEVGDPELAVAVREADQRIARSPQAGPERRAVALVQAVVDSTNHTGMLGGEPVRDGARAIGAAIVDRDDLESLGQDGQLLQRLCDELLDVLGLIVGREEVAQAIDAVGVRGNHRARSGPPSADSTNRSPTGLLRRPRRHPTRGSLRLP